MMHAALLLSLLAQDVQVDYEAPGLFIEGEPYEVTLTASAPDGGAAAMPAWYLTPAAFGLDGRPLGERGEESYLTLVAGQSVTTNFDLSPIVEACESYAGRDFRLSFAPGAGEPRELTVLQAAPMGIDFMSLPEEQLDDYQVVMKTVAGPLWMEFWPDVAPNHVRNFLDLCYKGFYDDNQFHRVVPGFMIQGGKVPEGRESPRRLKNEFNDRRHVPGVLSMARYGVDTPDGEGNLIPKEDSATTEFFVMHAVYPSLDGQYTAFGKLIQGLDVVEEIVHTGNDAFPKNDPRAHKPTTRQTIHKAIVVKAKQP